MEYLLTTNKIIQDALKKIDSSKAQAFIEFYEQKRLGELIDLYFHNKSVNLIIAGEESKQVLLAELRKKTKVAETVEVLELFENGECIKQLTLKKGCPYFIAEIPLSLTETKCTLPRSWHNHSQLVGSHADPDNYLKHSAKNEPIEIKLSTNAFHAFNPLGALFNPKKPPPIEKRPLLK